MATRNKPAYFTFTLSWTEIRMLKPVMAMEMGMSVNAKRWRVKSEQKAMIMAKPNAHAQGGTLCSCVWMGEYPYVEMMPGAKNA